MVTFFERDSEGRNTDINQNRFKMNNFSSTIDTLKKRPEDLLNNVCIFSLNSFLQGYKLVDSSIIKSIENIDTKKTTLNINSITEHILLNGNNSRSFYNLLSIIEKNYLEETLDPVPGIMHDKNWVEYNRDWLISRPGAIIGDTILSSVFCQLNGHIEAMKYINLERFNIMNKELCLFSNFICTYFAVKSPCWYDVIRIFEGEGEDGISCFIKLWDKFKNSPEQSEVR